MQKSGRTPLLRARKLEKLFDVGEIYIKLEGANPSGHKHDRIAEILIKDAKAHGHKVIIANGSYSYIKSIKYFAELESMKVIIPVFKNEQWKIRRFGKIETTRVKLIKGQPFIFTLNNLASSENAYLASEGYSSNHLSQMSLESLTEEMSHKLRYNIDTIFTQLGCGYTITSIYSTMLRYWIEGRIEKFPKMICGTWPDANSIYEHYRRTNNASTEALHKTDDNDQTTIPVQVDRRLLEESLQSVYETSGEIHSVDEVLLKESAKLLRKQEHIKISTNEAYPFASFYSLAQAGKLRKGRHVIILNDAKSAVKVENINDYDELSKEKLIDYTRTWLAQYSDSILETEEAIQNAMEKGFILLASRNGNYEGICIVANMGFDHFHPTYHLAYVGTEKTSKGRGVATELIQHALDLSEGKLSLHVDLDNKGAMKLYEKLGFKHCYNRMIYKDS